MRLLPLLLILPLANLTAHAQAPIITTFSPVRNAVAAPRAASVAVTFSQPMQNTSATQQAVRVFSQQRGGLMYGSTRGAATVSGNTITFDPAQDFKPGETVMVITTTGATAMNGAPLTRGHVHQFTTAVMGGTRGTFVPHPTTPEVSVGAGPWSVVGAGRWGVEGIGPWSVAVGDVDGDGDLDLLTASFRDDTVSIRLNNGTGSFSGGSNVSVGDGPANVTVGDVDGDGDLDLLTANQGAGTVSVRFNDGNGAFSGTQDVLVGYSRSVVVGDVDGDGDLDFLAANTGSFSSGPGNSVSVLFNNGSGTFTGYFGAFVGEGPASVAVGDVDGDGDLDLLTANRDDNTVSVRINDGLGNFNGRQDVSVGVSPVSVALGDVDGDGDLDLLVSTTYRTIVSVRLNDGLGTFSGIQNVSVGSYPESVAVGDVDGDGDLDLLTANYYGNSVSVRSNDGAGTFSGTQDVAVGLTPRSVAVGDVDGDGDLDLLTANFGANTVSVRLNGGTGPALGTALAFEVSATLNGRFTLRATLPGARYTVLDALGRTVATGPLPATESKLDLSHQPPGLYLLRLTGPDGCTATRRLVR